MSGNGLYSGFESYWVPSSMDIQKALQSGMVALDTNILLNLYRYNEKTVDDLLRVLEVASDRLFVPHQVVREFWRNRQSVISSLGSASKEAQSALSKNAASTKDALTRWARSVALPEETRASLEKDVDEFYTSLRGRVDGDVSRVSAHAPTSEDGLLQRLEGLLDGVVGPALSAEAWEEAVQEGQRRVENQIPPGYMDADKLDSDLSEGASGDYLVWHQLLIEGSRRAEEVTPGLDLVLVTADTKEDWWNRAARGSVVGPRRELVEEYLHEVGGRLFLLEPADLIKRSVAAFKVETSLESLQDIERVRAEELEEVLWTADAARAVLKELDVQGHTQGEVIREAISKGGMISRERVYELDGRDKSQMLRGFTKPVKRVTTELQLEGVVPYGVAPLLDAVYESGVRSTHFVVPQAVVELLRDPQDA